MSAAKSGDTVRIHYTGTLEDGTQFDSSAGREPLEFSLGSGQVIPGFDNAVDGMSAGEKKSVTIPAEDAYGERQDELVHEVPRSQLPEDIEPEQGMQLQAQHENGQVMRFVVLSVEQETITLDGNHPLAGRALNFDIELVEIVA